MPLFFTEASTTTPVANCTIAGWGQLLPIESSINADRLAEYEAEVANPSGASTIRPRPARMHGILYSPDCAFLLQVTEADSLTSARFWRKAVHYSAALAIVTFIQVLLLVSQMEFTPTASVSTASCAI